MLYCFRIVTVGGTSEQKGRPVSEVFNHPVFEGLSAESLALLSPDMARYFRSGDHIIRESETNRSCIAILEGEVQIFAQGTFLASRRVGEVLGEQAIIDGSARDRKSTR